MPATREISMATTPEPTGDVPAPPRGRRRQLLLVSLALGLVGLAAGWLFGPQHQRLGDSASGDPALAEKVRAASDNDHGLRSLVVAEFTSDKVTWTGLGSPSADLAGPAPTDQTPYEIGSITKTFTGSLYQIAIDKGEVRAADTVGQHLPELATTPAGGVTLESLAQHTSGLPGFPPAMVATSLLAQLTNENPYDVSTADVLEQAKGAPLKNPGSYLYSNLGVMLLGESVTRAAGAADWTTLVHERVLDPMGMTNTILAPTAEDIPADAAVGYNYNGLRAPRWTGEAFLPVGSSTFSTTGDMARWGQAMLKGTAPGAKAMEPTTKIDLGSIGRTWNVSEINGRTITWHNGATGGFRTMLALDREAGRGYLVMGNTTRWVDGEGLRLASANGDQLPDQPATTGESAMLGWIMYAIGALFLISGLWSAVRGKHRLALVGAAFGALTGLVIAWTSGPWNVVGGLAYGPLLAVALVTVALVALRWQTVPVRPAKWLIPAILSTALTVLVAVASFTLF